MGHWIKNCPLNSHHDTPHIEMKRSTGIPRSFIDGMQNESIKTPIFAYIAFSNWIQRYNFLFIDFGLSCVHAQQIAGNSPATEPINLPPVEKKQEIPEDLICSICKDLFTDAVMIACCGSSFCDECKFVHLFAVCFCVFFFSEKKRTTTEIHRQLIELLDFFHFGRCSYGIARVWR